MHRVFAAFFATVIAAAQPMRLTVNTALVTHTIDERIYSQAVDASIWGEAVRNPRFAAAGAVGEWRVNGGVLECADPKCSMRLPPPRDYALSVDVRGDSGATLFAGPVSIPPADAGWHHLTIRVADERVQASIDGRPAAAEGTRQLVLGSRGGLAHFRNLRVTTLDGQPLFSGIPLSVAHWFAVGAAGGSGRHLVTPVNPDAESAIEQHGISVRAGDTLRGSLRLGGLSASITVQLVEGGTVIASQTLPGGVEVPVTLTPTVTTENATLRIVLPRHADLIFEQITLFPDSARATGGFRPGPLQALAALRPPMLRWSASDWKTEAFGIDQFLDLAARLRSEPVVTIPASMTPAEADEIVRQCATRVKFFDRGGMVFEWNPQSAIETAALLNRVERDPKIAMAAPAQPLGADSASYAVMKLYRDHFASDALQIAGDLDGAASRTPDARRIYVKLVNRGSAAVPVEIGLRGDFPLLAAEVKVIAGGKSATNAPIEQSGLTVRFEMPAESVGVVTLLR